MESVFSPTANQLLQETGHAIDGFSSSAPLPA